MTYRYMETKEKVVKYNKCYTEMAHIPKQIFII